MLPNSSVWQRVCFDPHIVRPPTSGLKTKVQRGKKKDSIELHNHRVLELLAAPDYLCFLTVVAFRSLIAPGRHSPDTAVGLWSAREMEVASALKFHAAAP